MPEQNVRNTKDLHLRAKMPKYFRIGALCVLGVTVLAIVVGFYRERNKTPFRLKSEHTQLSKDVVAEVNGYERLETEGNVPKYYIKADKATTFSDNHQEMENVFLQVYDESGTNSDKITGARALYIPEENKNFTAYIAGDVNIETRDALKVKTEHITYTKANETAVADEAVEFERENVRGKSFGAIVKVKEKILELLKDVQIDTFESPELAKSNIRQSKITAGFASVDQLNEKISLEQNVFVNILSTGKTNNAPQNTDVHSGRAVVSFSNEAEGNPELTTLELFDNVNIAATENGGKPTRIESGYALYDKPADRFQLKNAVHIITNEDERPTDIRSAEAIYEQAEGKVFLFGGAEITQVNDYIKGDNITAELYPNKKLNNSFVKGNAYVRQIAPERTTEVSSVEVNASFNEAQQLLSANAVGASTAVLTPAQATEYTKVSLSAPKAIQLLFKGEGLLEKMQTEGRTTIQLDVPNNGADAANKRVTADRVRTFFNASGKDIQRAEAVGDAELYVEPLKAAAANYKTTINAPRFDCEFYPTGNNARSCVGATKTKTVRVPTVQAANRGTQTMTADKLLATFSQQTKDVESMEAVGNAKFSELDRHAAASQMTFTSGDETVRLRGREPTVWDLKARAKAKEIDWDTKNEKSHLRGGVSTTYYSQKQTDGATPFSDPGKPVFITAETAEFDHRSETGVYAGNARGWQENNYVRAERFLIKQKEGQFFAEKGVQSLLYNVKRKENGKESTAPAYASAAKMAYSRDTRVLRYENQVDIRQGTDRITSEVANIYLNEKNEVSQTIVENNVVITQPNRRATGSYAQYTTADERVVLRGNPAHVQDAENGSSQGGELTMFIGDNRVIGEGKSKQNSAGRIRSVYKVKSGQ